MKLKEIERLGFRLNNGIIEYHQNDKLILSAAASCINNEGTLIEFICEWNGFDIQEDIKIRNNTYSIKLNGSCTWATFGMSVFHKRNDLAQDLESGISDNK